MSRHNKKNPQTEPPKSEPPKLNSKERQAHIEEIWRILAKANKTQREKLIGQLDEDTLTDLRARGNPFSQAALYQKNKGNRILLFSLFSPHEKYVERLAMTSLIGFLFRMLDEYVPEEAKQYMSESEPQFVKVYEAHVKKFMREKPSGVLSNELQELTTREAAIQEQLALNATSVNANETQNSQNTQKNTKDGNISDDEDVIKVRSEKVLMLKKELADIEKKIMENAAKTHAYKIGVLSAQVDEMQPMLKSLTKDYERNRDVRKNIKQYLRMLLAEKDVAAARENPATVSSDAPLQDKSLQTDATTLSKQNKPKKTNKPNKQRTGTTVKADDKRPSRALSVVNEDVRTNMSKLDASTEILQVSTDKLNAHQAQITELTTQIDEQKAKLDVLQRAYYAKYIKQKAKKDTPKKPTQAKIKQSKTDKFEVHKMAFAHLEVGATDDLTPEEDYNIKTAVKAELDIEKTQEESSDSILDNIEEFLYEYLVFNPDNHVKCAYKPNYKDPTRTPLKIDKKSGMIMDEQFERKLVPPIDTFKRWERYREANYEELRQATDDIYSEKSDFEWAIVPLEVFEGQDAKERAEEWERKHAKEVDLSIRSVNFNEISLLGPWAQNRENYNYYTKDTEILKRMIDTHKEEERFANQMTKDRMQKKKEENQSETGADDQGLNDYLQAHPNNLEKYGAKRSLTAKDLPRDDTELPDDEVQIEVVNLGAKRVGRRWKPTSEKWKFHVPAEPLKTDQIITHTPDEFHKEQAAAAALPN